MLNGFWTTIIKADSQPANDQPYDEYGHYGHQESFQGFKDNAQIGILFHDYFPFFCTDNLDYSFIGDSEFS